MGLDFSHGHASWSYSGFNRARTRLAAVFGIQLDQMIGFRGHLPWPNAHKVPIVHLLSHSDCDGEFTLEQCGVVAPVLRKAVEPWPDDDYDKQMFLALADAMDECVDLGEVLEFT